MDSQEALVLRGLRVLLVEDELDSADLVTCILEPVGSEVKACASVGAGLKAVGQFNPHIFLGNLSLPDEVAVC
ncbi:MAG: hypothetical protein KME10_19595 [Plectolyngbya sp. WJT66-NPBG17]|jgi:DNA-binding response OmpR family regulator|nr:hypothetical protein [Plectolyngbya sp. WJT66-NPBG17]MBW4528260.1 hypothetical protein [Phormidium tanganyikae FI6-MK23]